MNLTTGTTPAGRVVDMTIVDDAAFGYYTGDNHHIVTVSGYTPNGGYQGAFGMQSGFGYVSRTPDYASSTTITMTPAMITEQNDPIVVDAGIGGTALGASTPHEYVISTGAQPLHAPGVDVSTDADTYTPLALAYIAPNLTGDADAVAPTANATPGPTVAVVSTPKLSPPAWVDAGGGSDGGSGSVNVNNGNAYEVQLLKVWLTAQAGNVRGLTPTRADLDGLVARMRELGETVAVRQFGAIPSDPHFLAIGFREGDPQQGNWTFVWTIFERHVSLTSDKVWYEAVDILRNRDSTAMIAEAQARHDTRTLAGAITSVTDTVQGIKNFAAISYQMTVGSPQMSIGMLEGFWDGSVDFFKGLGYLAAAPFFIGQGIGNYIDDKVYVHVNDWSREQKALSTIGHGLIDMAVAFKDFQLAPLKFMARLATNPEDVFPQFNRNMQQGMSSASGLFLAISQALVDVPDRTRGYIYGQAVAFVASFVVTDGLALIGKAAWFAKFLSTVKGVPVAVLARLKLLFNVIEDASPAATKLEMILQEATRYAVGKGRMTAAEAEKVLADWRAFVAEGQKRVQASKGKNALGAVLEHEAGLGSTEDFVIQLEKGKGIYGALDKNGIVHFTIGAGEESSIRGTQLVKKMMDHFGSYVKGLGGSWTKGTNLEKMNELTAKGVLFEEALTQTWTGRQAAKYGFKKISNVVSKGSPGNYSYISVIFE